VADGALSGCCPALSGAGVALGVRAFADGFWRRSAKTLGASARGLARMRRRACHLCPYRTGAAPTRAADALVGSPWQSLSGFPVVCRPRLSSWGDRVSPFVEWGCAVSAGAGGSGLASGYPLMGATFAASPGTAVSGRDGGVL